MERRRALLGALPVFWMVISGCSAADSTESVVGTQTATTVDVSTTDVSGVGSSADQEMGLPGAEDCADDARPPGTIVVAEPAEWLPINHMANQAQVAVVATIEDVSAPRFTGVALPNDEYGVPSLSAYFRVFTLSVQELLFGAGPEISSAPIRVVAFGAGSVSSGDLCFGDDGFATPEVDLAVGDDVLVLLDFAMTRPIVNYPEHGAFALPFGSLSVWRVDGANTISIAATHSISFTDLKARLVHEREVGPLPWQAADDGVFDPLEDPPIESDMATTMPEIATPPPGLTPAPTNAAG